MKGILNLIRFLISWFILFLISIGIGNLLENSFLGVLIFLICLVTYYLLVFRKSEKRVAKAYSKLNDILMKDETIIEKGIDKRPFALTSRRQVFAVTNSRIIRIARRRLGGFEMDDFQWKDLKDAQVSENVLSSFCGSTLTFEADNREIRLGSGVENHCFTFFPEYKVSSNAYKYSQQAEQSWEEKRRIRAMEEKRAEAGGIMIGQNTSPALSTGTVSQGNQNPTSKTDITDELFKLKKLLDEGIISDAEFQEMKSKILANSTQNF